MTPDPTQHLTDIGWRLLRTVQHLVTPPGPEQVLGSYGSLFVDPVVALSDICTDAMGRRGTAPVAADDDDHPIGLGSHPLPGPNARHALLPTSRGGTVAPPTRPPRDGHDKVTDPRKDNLAEVRPDKPGDGTSRPSPFGQPGQATEGLTSHLDESESPELGEATAAPGPGGPAAWGGSPAGSPVRHQRSATDGTDRYPEAPQTASGKSPSRSNPYSAQRPPTGESQDRWDRESFRGDRSETQRSAWREPRRAEVRAGDDKVRGMGEAEDPFPPNGSRLTASTERLAAMLRAHVGRSVPSTGTEGEEGFSGGSGEGGSGIGLMDEPAWARPDIRVGVEEIMERLADELESEFVRTYGRSGD